MTEIQKSMISIKEIVSRYDLPYSTINHYTLVGLLTVVGRRKNIRLYDAKEVEARLARIAQLRSIGYPLHLILQELNQVKGN